MLKWEDCGSLGSERVELDLYRICLIKYSKLYQEFRMKKGMNIWLMVHSAGVKPCLPRLFLVKQELLQFSSDVKVSTAFETANESFSDETMQSSADTPLLLKPHV